MFDGFTKFSFNSVVTVYKRVLTSCRIGNNGRKVCRTIFTIKSNRLFTVSIGIGVAVLRGNRTIFFTVRFLRGNFLVSVNSKPSTAIFTNKRDNVRSFRCVPRIAGIFINVTQSCFLVKVGYDCVAIFTSPCAKVFFRTSVGTVYNNTVQFGFCRVRVVVRVTFGAGSFAASINKVFTFGRFSVNPFNGFKRQNGNRFASVHAGIFNHFPRTVFFTLFANNYFVAVTLNTYFSNDFFLCASSVLDRVFYEYVFAFFVQGAALFALRTLGTYFTLRTLGTLFAYSTVGTISTIFTGSAVLTLQRFEPFFHRTSKPIINCELISRFPIFTATSKSKRKAQCKHR